MREKHDKSEKFAFFGELADGMGRDHLKVMVEMEAKLISEFKEFYNPTKIQELKERNDARGEKDRSIEYWPSCVYSNINMQASLMGKKHMCHYRMHHADLDSS